jgi:hypothetical protein
MTEWTYVNGILAQGYRVASGPSADYPYGALDRQRPIFKTRGLDLSGYFNDWVCYPHPETKERNFQNPSGAKPGRDHSL